MIQPANARSPGQPLAAVMRVRLVAFAADGCLIVQDAQGQEFACDWLDSGLGCKLELNDELLAIGPSALSRGVVLGRVGPYAARSAVLIEAAEGLTLKCGAAQLHLQPNGNVALQGEDVLLRAKGTQRIRAGHVAIN